MADLLICPLHQLVIVRMLEEKGGGVFPTLELDSPPSWLLSVEILSLNWFGCFFVIEERSSCMHKYVVHLCLSSALIMHVYLLTFTHTCSHPLVNKY
jgi:hypothetical protein